MPKAQIDPRLPTVPVGDPRRSLKIARLTEARRKVDGLASRKPILDDPEFKEWEQAVHSLLTELFGAGSYLLRFRKLRIRPINHIMGLGPAWSADPMRVWKTGLEQAARLLDEALEEARIEVPAAPPPAHRTVAPSAPPIHVTITNQNVFSAELHITLPELLQRLDGMGLSPGEKAVVAEQLRELEAETTGAKRWPNIAASLEAIKSMGKAVYRDLAVPLIVEFLKRESGLSGKP